MELLQCASSPPPPNKTNYRAKSEEKEGKTLSAVRTRRPSLPAPAPMVRRTSSSAPVPTPPVRRTSSSASIHNTSGSGWSAHYGRKKSTETLDRLTSRTLSPAPETLPRKYSRSASTVSNPSSSCVRLARHPALPPLTSEQAAPSLKDYLHKPRLVNTGTRRPSKVEDASVDELVPGLSKLTSYYNQTFLNVCDTCQSLSHINPVSVLKTNINRGM